MKNYTTYTTDTTKKEWDKDLVKMATGLYTYLFIVEDDKGNKILASHTSGDASKKIPMVKDKAGLLRENRLVKVGAILNSLLEENNVSYRVALPNFDNLKVGDNVIMLFVSTDAKTKNVSCKAKAKKATKDDTTKDDTTKGKKATKGDATKGDAKSTNELINEKSIIEYLNSISDFSFIVNFLTSKGYKITK